MGKNYINTRIASAKPNIVRHNFSSSAEERSRSQDETKMNLNENYFFDRDSKTMKVLTTTEAKQLRLSMNFLKSEADRKFRQDYKIRRKENLKKDIGFLEGVFTFSEDIDNDLGKKYSLDDLGKAAQKATEEICEYLGTKQVGPVVAHDDEKRIHFHYHMENFDKSRDGYSLKYKYRKKEHLSKLQDIAFKHFSKLGTERGVKKEITTANYKKQSEYHKEKLQKEIIDKGFKMNKQLNDYIDIFENIIDENDPIKLELMKIEIMKNKKENKDDFLPNEIKISNLMMRTITQKLKGNEIENNIKKFNIQKNELHIENEKLLDKVNEKIDNEKGYLGNIDADTAKEIIEEVVVGFESSIISEKIKIKNEYNKIIEEKQELENGKIELKNKLKKVEDIKPIKNENQVLKTELEDLNKKIIKEKQNVITEKNNFINYKAIQNKKEKREYFVSEIKYIDPRSVFNFDFGKSNNDNFFNCYSPLRDDGKNPAMTWKFYENNGWKFKDHGTDESGDLIDFLQLSQNKDFNEIVKMLENNENMEITNKYLVHTKETKLKYERSEIYFTPLKHYLKERKIEKIPSWLDQYKFKNPDGKSYYSLGIKNNAGGINIRNKKLKGCRGNNDFSHLVNDKENNKLVICEGLFDALHLNQKIDHTNFVSLNSIENTKSFLEKFDFSNYKEIFIMLDNDKMAYAKKIEIEKHLRTLPVVYRSLKSNLNDFAEDCEKDNFTLNRFVEFNLPDLEPFKKNQVLQDVRKDGMILNDLEPKYKNDKSVILEAAFENKNCLMYVKDKKIRDEIIDIITPKKEEEKIEEKIETPKPKKKKEKEDLSHMRMR